MMKTLIRRITGMLVAVTMLFGSAISVGGPSSVAVAQEGETRPAQVEQRILRRQQEQEEKKNALEAGSDADPVDQTQSLLARIRDLYDQYVAQPDGSEEKLALWLQIDALTGEERGIMDQLLGGTARIERNELTGQLELVETQDPLEGEGLDGALPGDTLTGEPEGTALDTLNTPDDPEALDESLNTVNELDEMLDELDQLDGLGMDLPGAPNGEEADQGNDISDLPDPVDENDTDIDEPDSVDGNDEDTKDPDPVDENDSGIDELDLTDGNGIPGDPISNDELQDIEDPVIGGDNNPDSDSDLDHDDIIKDADPEAQETPDPEGGADEDPIPGDTGLNDDVDIPDDPADTNPGEIIPGDPTDGNLPGDGTNGNEDVLTGDSEKKVIEDVDKQDDPEIPGAENGNIPKQPGESISDTDLSDGYDDVIPCEVQAGNTEPEQTDPVLGAEDGGLDDLPVIDDDQPEDLLPDQPEEVEPDDKGTDNAPEEKEEIMTETVPSVEEIVEDVDLDEEEEEEEEKAPVARAVMNAGPARGMLRTEPDKGNNPIMVKPTITGDSDTYDGEKHPAIVTVEYADGSQEIDSSKYEISYSTSSDSGFSTNEPKDVGSYYVKITLTDPAYTFDTGATCVSDTAEVIISKAQLSVSWGTTTQFEYNGTPKTPFDPNAVSGIISGDDNAYSVSYYNTQNPGSQLPGDAIDAGSYIVKLTAGDNYIFAVDSGTAESVEKTFTINATIIKAEIKTQSVVYSGTEQEPYVKFTKTKDGTLVTNAEYTATYKASTASVYSSNKPKDADTYDVKIETDGNYVFDASGTKTKEFTGAKGFTITRAKITPVLSTARITYDGEPHTPQWSFTKKDSPAPVTLKNTPSIKYKVNGTSGEYSKESLTDAGKYDVLIELTGDDAVNYSFDDKTTYTNSNAFEISQAELTISSWGNDEYVYNRSEQYPTPQVIGFKTTAETQGNSCSVTYSANEGTTVLVGNEKPKFAGSYKTTVTITSPNYTFKDENNNNVLSLNQDFTIKKTPVTATLSPNSKVYDPDPTLDWFDKIKYNDSTADINLVVAYGESNVVFENGVTFEKTNNNDVFHDYGSYTITWSLTAKDKDNFDPTTGTLDFSVTKQNEFTVGLDTDTVTYNGEDWKSIIEGGFATASINNKPMVLGTDFELSYRKNDAPCDELVDVGTYQVIFTGIGNYEGEQPAQTFTIKPAPVAEATLTYNTVGYRRGVNWFSSVYANGETVPATNPNMLSVKTEPVKFVDEDGNVTKEEALTLKSAEYQITNAAGTTFTDAGAYNVTWALTGGENSNYSAGASLTNVPFTIQKAKIQTAALTYDAVTYDRETDWAGYIQVGPAADGDLAHNDLEITFESLDPTDTPATGTYTKDLLVTDEISFAPDKMINAGSYDVVWALTDAAAVNYEIADESLSTLAFEIKPAQVKARPLTYSSVTYDRHNWEENLYLKGVAVPASYPNLISAYAVGVEGTYNQDLVTDLELNTEDGFKGRTTTDMTDVRTNSSGEVTAYGITVTVNDNFTVSGTTAGDTFTLSFTVKPAKVNEMGLTYASATYDRHNWDENIYLKGATAPESYPNQISAYAVGEAGTCNESMSGLELNTTDGFIERTTQDMTAVRRNPVGEIATYFITVTVNSNFTVGGTTPGDTFTLSFTVKPAKVNEMGLAYTSATYDRHDWDENVYLKGATAPASYPNQISAYAVGVAGTCNENMSGLELNTTDGFIERTTQDMTAVRRNPAREIATYFITVTVNSNFTVGGTTPGDTFTLFFRVNPAQLSSAALTYNAVAYDRHNWTANVKTYDHSDDQADYDNILTVKTAADDYGTVLTLNETGSGEYEVNTAATGSMTAAGSYSVQWTLKDTNNFIFAGDRAGIVSLPFTVAQANIASVTIQRNDQEAAATKAETPYDAADWVPRIGINSASGEHHFFTVVARTAAYAIAGTDYTIPAYDLNTVGAAEISLSYPKADTDGKMIEASNEPYTVQVNVDDVTNYRYAENIGLPGKLSGADPYVQMDFMIYRNQVEPITDVTTTTTEPSQTTPVTFNGIYHVGPKQQATARTLSFTGEPGEAVTVTVGETVLHGIFSGDRLANYAGGSTVGTLTMTINGEGVVSIGTAESATLAANTDVTFSLAYTDAANLRKKTGDAIPDTLAESVQYDTINPQIDTAVTEFRNRDSQISFRVPEPGRLENLRFNDADTDQIGPITYVSVATDYTTFTDTRNVNWNSATNPHLISSGQSALSMSYTDLVYNQTTTTFAIGQSAGAGIGITVEPIVGRENRIDMSGSPEQFRVTVSGTGWEKMNVTLVSEQGATLMTASGVTSGNGSWARDSLGDFTFAVDTDLLPKDAGIHIRAVYDDLSGNGEYDIYFDNEAYPLIMTLPAITEDNWVITGIVEPGSSVEVYVNGERVTNRKWDPYGVFAAMDRQMMPGDVVRIVAVDLSNNRSEKIYTVETAPADGTQKLDAYAAGKVYTTAKESDRPEWMMAGYYTREELENGVEVPLIAGNAFNIGTVSMKLADGSVEAEFHPLDGVSILEQNVQLQVTSPANKAFEFNGFTSSVSDDSEDNAAFWVKAYVKASVPMNLLQNTFHLDDGQLSTREFYFNCQRKNNMSLTK